MNKNIVFFNSVSLSDNQIEQMEKSLSKNFPIHLRNFFKENSNGIPKINNNYCLFRFQHQSLGEFILSFEKIIGLEGIFAEFADRDTLDLYVMEQNLTTDFVEIETLCPFAYAHNGVFYCSISGKHNGKVYFADNGDFGIFLIANSFEEFWNSVYEDKG